MWRNKLACGLSVANNLQRVPPIFIDAADLLLKQLPKNSYLPAACLQSYALPPDFSNIKLPEERNRRRLPIVEKNPAGYEKNYKLWKTNKYIKGMRGPELVHNELLLGQYGVQAWRGGQLRHGHFEMMRLTVNRNLDLGRMYAMYRVDPPWKPITRKGQGKRMGGGKGSVHHYTTPVRAGRIIFEVAGRMELKEIKKWLTEVADKLPFPARVVTKESLEEEARLLDHIKRNNINPDSFEAVVRNNMLGWNLSYGRPTDWEWWGRYQ